MKFGFRIPSITKRLVARTSVKRMVQNELGLKAPRGYGWITYPHKFFYNKVYNKTTAGTGCILVFLVLIPIPVGFVWFIFS